MSLTPQKLLIIGFVWPEPNSSAAGIRMMQLIQCFLEQGADITFASPAKLSEHKVDLASLGVQEQLIQLNDVSVDAFLTALSPSLVIFDRFIIEEQFGWRVEKTCPMALRILNTEDLHSLREARHQCLKQAIKNNPKLLKNELNLPETQRPSPLFAALSASELALREIAAIYRCDLTLMISSFETALLTQLFQVPQAILHTYPFQYDLPDFSVNPIFEDRQHFIWIGNFRHAPNWDAVLTLKKIWPEIRKRLPEAELHIYGAYPPKKATDLQNIKQGFLVKGWAEDALKVIRKARLLLAPIRFGAGIKGKLSEAMLAGTPSITTPIGAESMTPSLDQWNGVITSEIDTFIEQAVRLYQDKLAWQQAQQIGERLFVENYAQKEASEYELLAQITTLQQTLIAHRLANFTGKMLRHHHHKSTQYMAQWIEAKNKMPLSSQMDESDERVNSDR